MTQFPFQSGNDVPLKNRGCELSREQGKYNPMVRLVQGFSALGAQSAMRLTWRRAD